jgi:hypothetical protein
VDLHHVVSVRHHWHFEPPVHHFCLVVNLFDITHLFHHCHLVWRWVQEVFQYLILLNILEGSIDSEHISFSLLTLLMNGMFPPVFKLFLLRFLFPHRIFANQGFCQDFSVVIQSLVDA